MEKKQRTRKLKIVYLNKKTIHWMTESKIDLCEYQAYYLEDKLENTELGNKS